MKITLEPTSEFVTVNGAQGRVWTGATANGSTVTAIISRVAIAPGPDADAFARLLDRKPSDPAMSAQVVAADLAKTFEG